MSKSTWNRFAVGVICFSILFLVEGCRCISRPWEGVSSSWNTEREFDVDKRHATGDPIKGLAIGIERPLISGSDAINVLLRNDSDHPITVYRSFRVDTGQFDADSDLFFIVIEKATGGKAELRTHAWTDSSDHHNPRSYYQMAPKEIVSQKLEIGKFYKLFSGGVYDVSVEYDHRESGFEQSRQWIEMNAWTGRCRSNHLTLSLPAQ